MYIYIHMYVCTFRCTYVCVHRYYSVVANRNAITSSVNLSHYQRIFFIYIILIYIVLLQCFLSLKHIYIYTYIVDFLLVHLCVLKDQTNSYRCKLVSCNWYILRFKLFVMSQITSFLSHYQKQTYIHK